MRVAKERPCKAEALAKPAREIGPSAIDDRIVGLRQPDDRFVEAGQLCCFNDLLQIGVVQPRNDVSLPFLRRDRYPAADIRGAGRRPRSRNGQDVDAVEQDATLPSVRRFQR